MICESDERVSGLSHGFGDEVVPKARLKNGRTTGPTRRSAKGRWTSEEDDILRTAVQKYKGKNWKKIAECFKDRTDVQCLHRWQKVLNPDLIKGPWTKEEDEMIIQLVNKHGAKKWSLISQHLPGRIGKQCRERWHNHLNPSINKGAWTEEEELILIHAHQTYGNRWADLTKLLPGRSDNAIKNHWNSSVKKKLDTYLASGLLSQPPPLSIPQNQPMPPSSSRKRNNEYGSCPTPSRTKAEMSECSRESAIVACSQSGREMTNSVLEVKEEMHWTEEHGSGKEPSYSLVSYIGQYYPLDGVNLSIPERPCEEGCSSEYPEQKSSSNVESSVSRICQFDMHQLPDISSLQLGLDSSGFPMLYTDINRNQEIANNSLQTSAGMFSKSMEAIASGFEKPEHMFMSDDEFCRALFSDESNEGSSSHSNVLRETNMAYLAGYFDSLFCQSAPIQNLESYGHSEPEALGTCIQPCQPAHSRLSDDGNALISNGVSEDLHENHEEENSTMLYDVISNINNCATSNYGGADSTSMQDKLDGINDSPTLVLVNSFSPRLDKVQICCSPDEKKDGTTEQQDGGVLCYEPPRFPSLDIPVFSCDLIQHGGEMQNDYSPLGIRKLMSSIDCMSPFKLWDSPSRDGSPKAVLKSAAKTFKGPPSILKKRNRDLVSPLSDRRADKKLETNFSKNFSYLDVIYDKKGFHRTARLLQASPLRRISETITEEKENLCHPVEVGKDKGRDGCASLLSGRLLEKEFENCYTLENGKQVTVDDCGKGKFNADTVVHAVQKPSEVLMDHDVNDLQLHSPDKVRCCTFKTTYGTPKSPLSSKQNINVPEKSSGNSSLLPSSFSKLCGKINVRKSVPVTSIQTISTSAPLEIRVDNSRKETCTEGLSIFGDTPFKRGIESPSAWKSPWFFNSLLSCSAMEDTDYYISPGNISYDALGLMKQISEHTAATYAEAHEVLGNETPETVAKNRRIHNQNLIPQEEHSPSKCFNWTPNLKGECCILDSDCGTPKKGAAEHEKSPSCPSSIAFSSPSSYLLKACR